MDISFQYAARGFGLDCRGVRLHMATEMGARVMRMLIYAICVSAVFHLFIVLYEEAHLKRQFGAEYDKYCADVGRWLPHLHGRHAS